MEDILLAIPSYRRHRVETLGSYSRFHVFVSESEYEEYRRFNEGAYIDTMPDKVQGNLCRARNYIIDYAFNNGYEGVVIIDDDLSGIYRWDAIGTFGYDQHKLTDKELETFIENGFNLCYEWGYKMWGLNCSKQNKLAYRQFCPFNTNQYIGGPFQAFLKNDIRYDERLSLKEDYDMTLQHLRKYGGVLRFNQYHYMCRQAEQSGGCANYRNMEEEKRQFELLQKKWGSKIIKEDRSSKRCYDFNPIMKSPIKGV